MAGPKTIEAIHNEVKQEKKELELRELMGRNMGGGPPPPRRDDRDGRGGGGRGGDRGGRGGGDDNRKKSQMPEGEDGWNQVSGISWW